MLLLKIKVMEEMRLGGERRTGLTDASQEADQEEFSAEIQGGVKKTGKERPEGPGNRENDNKQEENTVNVSFCPLQSLQSSWGSKG